MNAFIASDECFLCRRRTRLFLATNVFFVVETDAFRTTNECVGNTRSNFNHTHTQLATKQKFNMWRWLLVTATHLWNGRLPRRRDWKVWTETVQARHICITASWSGPKQDGFIQVSLYTQIIDLQTTVSWMTKKLCYVDLYSKEENDLYKP